MIQCGRPTVTGIAGILAFLVTTIAPIAEAQLHCEMPPPAGIEPRPQGHTIVVYVRPSIPEPFKNAIKGAFQVSVYRSAGPRLEMGTRYRCTQDCRSEIEEVATPLRAGAEHTEQHG